jgi:hypothetical protein
MAEPPTQEVSGSQVPGDGQPVGTVFISQLAQLYDFVPALFMTHKSLLSHTSFPWFVNLEHSSLGKQKPPPIMPNAQSGAAWQLSPSKYLQSRLHHPPPAVPLQASRQFPSLQFFPVGQAAEQSMVTPQPTSVCLLH